MSQPGNGAAGPGAVADPLIGTKVGNYRLVRKLGAGGMGVVYAAEHDLMGKKAAVKLLLPELSANQEIVGRFFNEAKAAANINHPGIVDIYDFGYHQTGRAFITMEYLSGASLSELQKQGLDFGRVVDIAWQLSSALGAAHKRGIVHRDVKPDNVFVVPDPATPTGDRVKVLDFGIAKLTGEDLGSVSMKTRTGAVMGTPIYMSPEQCKGSGEVDHRSDIYGLGVIMFEMACGQPPFVRRGFGELITAHIVEPPPRLSAINPSVSTTFEAIVMRSLEKEPAHRYQSTDELEADLAAIDPSAPDKVIGLTAVGRAGSGRSRLRKVTAENPQAKPPVVDSTIRTLADPPRSPRKALAIGVALAAVIGVVVAAVISGGTRSEPTPLVQEAPAGPAAAVESAPVKITVTSTPPGASVVRAEDNAYLGRTPYQATFPKSSHELALIIRSEGFEDQRVTMPLLEDGKADVMLTAIAVAAPSTGEQKARSVRHKRVDGKKGAGAPAADGGDGKGGKKKRNWGDLVDF